MPDEPTPDAPALRVHVTRRLPPPGVQPLLDAGFDVALHDADEPPARDQLLEAVRGVHAILSMLTERIDAELLDAAGPSLRIVANYAVGFDNVDLAAAAARDVVVTNTPGVLTDATADLTFALLLAAARRIGEGERLVRADRWTGWGPTQLIGRPVRGQTLGIVGLGKIGSAVARRARGFDMEVLYASRHRDEAAEEALDVVPCSRDELLQRADFVSVNVPLTPETHHLFDAHAFARMKPTAVLVNTSRGPVIDEAALVEALRSGTIAAAGLDVFEREPAVEAGLRELDNVVLLPHLGSATTQARADMVRLATGNIVAVLSGDAPLTPVS